MLKVANSASVDEVRKALRRRSPYKSKRVSRKTGILSRSKLILKESEIQRSVFQHLDKHGAPDAMWWSIPNGGVHQASAGQRAYNGRLGVLSGNPDVHILRGGRLHVLELKADDGQLSDQQSEVLQRLAAAGAITGVAHGLDAALGWLWSHGLLRGRIT